MSRRVLFTDLDGTICFHEEAHGLCAVGREADGALLVEDAATRRRYRARDASTSSYRIYVAEETLTLLAAIAERCDVVLVTGGRPSTMEKRRALFGFARGVILENGGVILDRELRVDPAWQERLEPERRLLPEVARRLRAAGWTLDAEGRTSALRVRLRDNPHRTAKEFAKLCQELPLPAGLRKTMNLENLDIILGSAGKEGAVQFWIASGGYDRARTIGIGDDVNDIAFLRETAEPWVLASAYPAALEEARRGGWRVSAERHVDGINEILRDVLGRI